jgi:hypothetical protein
LRRKRLDGVVVADMLVAILGICTQAELDEKEEEELRVMEQVEGWSTLNHFILDL